MSEKQWVCHISGQGEKWEVLTNHVAAWQVMSPLSGATFMLPKSEYRLCDPPEVWLDVSEDVTQKESATACWWYWTHGEADAFAVHTSLGYRLRKVLVQMEGRAGTCWAFIVEQKVTQ